MAMLAEPRRKSKYSTDPRGLNWSKDEDKFGQKLMEKMGWAQGKGLGANEDGHVDHVAVRVKTDNRGVGCSKNTVDNWIAHQDDFNSLLADLQTNHKDSGDNDSDSNQAQKVTSLEEKSKKSKGRLHYHKFAKGKDLSACKEGDFDAIFGRRKSKSNPSTPQTVSEVNTDDEKESGNSDGENKTTEEHSHGITTITHTTSVSDYFAQKMAALKAKRSGAIIPDTKPAEMESVQSSQKKEKLKEETGEDSRASSESGDANEKRKKKKSKKKRKEEETAPDIEVASETTEEPIKKKKKKSKKNKDDDEDRTKSQSSLEEFVKESSKKSKKKKKQKKSDNESVSEDDTSSSKKRKRDSEDDQDSAPIKKKKKKDKKEKSLPRGPKALVQVRKKDKFILVDPNEVDEKFEELGSNLRQCTGYAYAD